MKKLIYGTSSTKFYTAMLPESELQDRLKIPVAEVKGRLLDNVDDADKHIISHLIDNKVFPTVASSHEMRNNPYYDLDDKFIQLSQSDENSRTYAVPYPGGGRFGSGKIFTQRVIVFDDGTIQIGNGKIRDPYKFAAGTLKAEFFK